MTIMPRSTLICDVDGCNSALAGLFKEGKTKLRQRAFGLGWTHQLIGRQAGVKKFDLCPNHAGEEA